MMEAVEQHRHTDQHHPALRPLEVIPEELPIPEGGVALGVAVVVGIGLGGGVGVVLEVFFPHDRVEKEGIEGHGDRPNPIIHPTAGRKHRAMDGIMGGDKQPRMAKRPKGHQKQD